jgi:hypothetical protein
MLEDFRSEVHLHVEAGQLPPSTPRPQAPEWWAIMQHYGAPTRLLDWTLSPFVAAYFAVESNWAKDGAIYLAHARVAQGSYADAFGTGAALTDEIFLNPSSADAILFWYPAKKSPRLVAQQGYLSLSTNVMSSHDELIARACAAAAAEYEGKLFFHKWIIPASQKPLFLRNLRAMNIAAHSLFPGLDGICRSAAETARLVRVV